MPGAPDKGEMNSGSSDSGGGIGSLPSGGVDNPSAKIIKIADATVKTLDYDTFIDELYAKITEYSGYTDGESFRGSAPSRTATVTVRIPADSLDAFKSALSGMGTMTYYNANKIDVSLQYATLSARIETLEVEIGVVEDLFEIAKEEGNLDRIYTLEQRLTALKLDLAESRAEIAVYDNSIAYSTVNLTVKEYEEVVEEEPESEEEKGAFAVTLECVPAELAAHVTAALRIPTIGIGAGPACDAQWLVMHDLLGLNEGHVPSFVKKFADLAAEAK